jgi:hypothetical protein
MSAQLDVSRGVWSLPQPKWVIGDKCLLVCTEEIIIYLNLFKFIYLFKNYMTPQNMQGIQSCHEVQIGSTHKGLSIT